MKTLFLVLPILLGCSSPAWRPTPTIGNPDHQTPEARQAEAAATLVQQLAATATQPAEKTKTIRGTCIVRGAADANISTPCHHVEIALVNGSGKEISSTQIEEGRFDLSVNAGERYRLKVKSDRYLARKEQLGPYQGGDNLTLELNRIPAP